jgi:multidrug resistance efflux pump
MRRRRIVLPFALAAVLGSYCVYNWYAARRPYQWSGTVEARSISVGSRIGGRVKEVLVHEGDRVRDGQPLLVLETGDLDAQRVQAEGQLAQAQAALEKARAGARPEEIAQAKARAAQAVAQYDETRAGARSEDIAAARARLEAAESNAQKATADAARTEKLAKGGAVSEQELDAARATMRSAVADRDAQKQSLDELVNGTRREQIAQAAARAQEQTAAARLTEAGTRIEDIRAAEAQVTAANGRLDQINADIEELTIRAPRAARVESLDLRPGDILGPNAPAATLLEDDQLYVRVFVPETRLALIQVGRDLPIYVDAFPDRAYQGTVERIADIGEYTPRNLQSVDDRADYYFATRINLKTGRDQLKAGMTAFVRVPK